MQEQPPARPESSMPKLNLDAPFLRDRDDPLPTKMEEMPRRQQVFHPEAAPLTNTAPVSFDPVKPEKYEPIVYRQEERPQEQTVEQAPSHAPYREQEFSFREPHSAAPAPVPKSKVQHGNRYQQNFQPPRPEAQAVHVSQTDSYAPPSYQELSFRESKNPDQASVPKSKVQHSNRHQQKFQQPKWETQEDPVFQTDSHTLPSAQDVSFRQSITELPSSQPKSTLQHGSKYQQKFRQPEQAGTQAEQPVASDPQHRSGDDSTQEKAGPPNSRGNAQSGSTYRSKFHQESQTSKPQQESTSGDAPPRQKSKLEFADDELPPQEKRLHQAQQKAERTARKLDKAEAHLPSKKKLRVDTQSDPETGKAKKHLKFEKEVKSQAAHVKGAVPLRPVKAGANAAIGLVHQKVYQVEHENVGTQAAHQAEMVAEAGARTAYHMHKTAPYRKVERLQKKSVRANTKAAYQQALHDNPQFQSNVFSRMAQKRKLKRQYAKTVREAQKAGTTVKSTATFTEKVTTAVTHSVRRHPILWLLLALLLALMLLVFSVFSVFSNIGTSVLGGIASSSYLASEQDIDQAEVIYTEWETDLKVQIENIPQDYPGYDEYRYDLDAIGHDPLQLMAFLTAKFRDFEYADVVGTLQDLFEEQYTLTLTQSTETDPESGEERYILNVKLTTKPFSQVIVSQLDEAERQFYDLLMDTQGNRQLIQNVFGFNWQPNISSHYGYRIHPITGVKTFHSGIDIGMGQGTEILAGHDGVVSFSGNNGGYGLCVILDGSIGGQMDLSTKYAHCSQFLVSEGQEVKAGDVIARVGSTGNSTGPHLHLEVLLNGQTVNPLYFADTGANESE